jgi:hypothetical protein
MADPRRKHPHTDLTWPGLRARDLSELERLADLDELDRPHTDSFLHGYSDTDMDGFLQ